MTSLDPKLPGWAPGLMAGSLSLPQSQSAFMVLARIIPGREAALRQLLDSMTLAPGLADPANALLPFGQFRRLHFARLLILEDRVGDDQRAHGREPRPWRPSLAVLGDCDGPADAFLAELAVRAGPGLRQLLAHCEGFDPAHDILLPWLQRHAVRPSANYVNYRGRTLAQVREEQALHSALQQQLASLRQPGTPLSPVELLRRLREHVAALQNSGQLSLAARPRPSAGARLWALLQALWLPLLLLMLAPLALLLLPLYLLALRWHEERDPEIVPRPDPARVVELAEQEDRLVTNAFSAFGDVKPGRFRRYTLLFLLFMLNWSARHIYNKGYLTRVQTIHFARWVLLDDGQRLLFASNYDGSLESYMDDFINKVAWGLNLVFSNGVGYPRTRWLIKGGAEQEQKFKYYLRRHQLPTQVWYKAYADASAVELARNSRIRQGLESLDEQDEGKVRQWLQLI